MLLLVREVGLMLLLHVVQVSGLDFLYPLTAILKMLFYRISDRILHSDENCIGLLMLDIHLFNLIGVLGFQVINTFLPIVFKSPSSIFHLLQLLVKLSLILIFKRRFRREAQMKLSAHLRSSVLNSRDLVIPLRKSTPNRLVSHFVWGWRWNSFSVS